MKIKPQIFYLLILLVLITSCIGEDKKLELNSNCYLFSTDNILNNSKLNGHKSILYKNEFGDVSKIEIIDDDSNYIEGYIFSNGKIKQYANFNFTYNEPVLVINYDTLCNLDNVYGNLLYIYGDEPTNGKLDTNYYEFYISTAYPLNYDSYIEILKKEDQNLINLKNIKMSSDFLFVNLDEIEKGVNNYLITGYLLFDNDTVFSDSLNLKLVY